MTEYNEIIKRYSILLEAMGRLEKEVPIIEETYNELQAIINNTSIVEKRTLEKIRTEAQESVNKANKIAVATKQLVQQYEKFETLVKQSQKQQNDFIMLAEEKTNELKGISSNNSHTKDIVELYNRLSIVESKLWVLEKQGNSSNNNQDKNNTVTYSTAKNYFPTNAKYFTFDNIGEVKGKKPYGIVIDGTIIKVQHWNKMLDIVVQYAFDKYKGDVDELCAMNYGITFNGKYESTDGFIPYFIKGNNIKNINQSYRFIGNLNLFVHYNGAIGTVEVLKLLLCDFFNIAPNNIELFYHDY